MKKRAVILLGAGASVEYGADSTATLTKKIGDEVSQDDWLQHTGADKAYLAIKDALDSYLHNPAQFEQIYHCAHELIYTFPPGAGAVDEFRPLLQPFLSNGMSFDDRALRSLAQKITSVIYHRISAACDKTVDLAPLTEFITTVRAEYTTRMYSTNYDDFPLQAAPDLYTGFDLHPAPGPKVFEAENFWGKSDMDSIFHLHGSVHLGFVRGEPGVLLGGDIGDLYWFDDRSEALKHESFSGSDVRRMDGSSFLRSSVLTGLDKLSRLQQRPMSHFYAAMAHDLMGADLIFIIGSGLGDLHLNTWLRESRLRKSPAPILLVDYWHSGFSNPMTSGISRKEIEMIHALRIKAGPHYRNSTKQFDWHIAEDLKSAVWDQGFQQFLAAPDSLKKVLQLLTAPS